MSEVLETQTTDPGNKERTKFEQRTDLIRAKFLEKPLNREIINFEDGGEVKVLSSVVEIPQDLKTREDPSEYKISLYVPTLWFTEEPDSIVETSLRETELATQFLSGDLDAAVLLRSEGMNDAAYKNPDGSGSGQRKPAEAAVDILVKQLEKLNIGERKIRLSILGYSEGSSLGASIAAELIKRGIGEVSEYVSIGGGGLIGAEDQNSAKPVEFIKDAVKNSLTHKKEPEGRKVVSPGGHTVFIYENGQDIYYIPKEIIGKSSKKSDSGGEGFEYSIGHQKTPNLKTTLEPEAVWFRRFFNTQRGKAEKNPIPLERIKAATTKNPDYKVLAENKVPVIVLSETQDTFFANDKVREGVKGLQQEYPESKIVLVNSNAGHGEMWTNPRGFAYALNLVRRKSGLN